MAEIEIDRYRVDRLIGQGAMGKIYLATDPKLERPVAIKMLNRARADADTRRRFAQEARSIAGLKHPNIVELYDYSDADEDELFLILEYVPGRTLYEHVTERGPMSEVTALAVAHELCLALAHAHGRQVVHRDLKPENVILSDSRVVLMDFGIVKKMALDGRGKAEAGDGSTRVLGTPGFMAPEQMRGENVGPQTDIFGLGALLYNLATGHAPFEGRTVFEVTEKNLEGRYADPRDYSPTLSRAFAELIGQCLKASPRSRVTGAEGAREAILRILRGHGVSEVREEIANYQQDPVGYQQVQNDRRLEVLAQDLRDAVRSGDQKQVDAIVEDMRLLAPLNKGVRQVTGLGWDKRQRPVLTGRRRAAAKSWRAFVMGVLLGGALGAVVGLLLVITGTAPTVVVAVLERFATTLGWLP